MYFSVISILVPSFQEIEDELAYKNTSRAVKALFYEIDNLAKKNNDWAVWTDSYNFISGKYPDYPDINVDVDTLIDFEVDLMFFYDANLSLYFSSQLDRMSDQLVEDTLTLTTIQDMILDPRLEGNAGMHGLVALDDGRLMLIAGKAIDDPHDDEGGQGLLVFGFDPL